MRGIFNRSLWTAARLLALVPPILMALFGAYILHREFGRSRPEIVSAITGMLSESTGLMIGYADIDTSVPGLVVGRDVTIGRTAPGDVLSARNVRMRYDLAGLVRDVANPASHITSVSVNGLSLHVERDRAGRISLVEAFRPKRPARRQKPFAGVVTISGSAVTFIDRAPPSHRMTSASVRATGVGGRLDFRSGRGAIFVADIPGTDHSGRLRVNGRFDYRGDVVTGIKFDKLSLPFLYNYGLPAAAPQLTAGRADGRFLLTFRARRAGFPHFWVDADVRGAGMRFGHGTPTLSDVNGVLQMSGLDALSFDATATAARSRWSVRGALADLRKPVLSIDASSSSVDYAAALAAGPASLRPEGFAASGRGPARIRAAGRLDALSVSAEAALPRARYAGYEARDVRGRAAYERGRVSLVASARVGQGRAAGRGDLTFGKTPSGNVAVRFTGIHVAPAALRFGGTEADGIASGDARIRLGESGAGAQVTFHVLEPRGLGVQASSARGKLSVEKNAINLDSVVVATPHGFLSASGRVGLRGDTDLRVTAAGIRIQETAAGLLPEGVSGTVDADGRISGTASNPRFEGDVQVMGLRYLDESFDLVRGNLTASRESISTTGITAYRGTSEVTLRGEVLRPLLHSRSFDLSADVRSLDLHELADHFPQLDTLYGRASGRIESLTGSFPEISLAFDLDAEDLRYGAVDVPLVAGRGEYTAGVFRLDSLRAERGTAVLDASGDVDETGRLDFNFRLERFSLNEALMLAITRGVPVSGEIGLTGSLRGTVADPDLQAKLSARDLNIAGEEVVLTDSILLWAEDRFAINDGSASLAGGVVTLDRLEFSTAPGSAGLSVAMVTIGDGQPDDEGNGGVDAARILRIVRSLPLLRVEPGSTADRLLTEAPQRVQGTVRGSAAVTRADGGLRVAGSLESGALSVWGVDLGMVSGSGSWGPEGYTLSELRMEDQDMLVQGSGSLDDSGNLGADVEGYNVALARIPGIAQELTSPGTADFSFEVSGTRADPKLQGSLLVSNAEVGGVRIERFTTGLVEIGANGADIREATISTGPYSVRAEGTLPFSLTHMSFVEGGEISLEASLVNPDLKFLALLSPRIDSDRTEGGLSGGVQVTGAWPRPEIRGEIRADGGQIAIHGMTTVFRGIDVDIDLQGDQVLFRRFRLPSSDGGALTVSGKADLGGGGWTIDSKAEAHGLALNLRNVSGVYDESFLGKLDVDVAVTGAFTSPLVSGRIAAREGAIGLPVIPETTPERVERSFNPAFDIALEAGKDLKVRGPRLNVGVEGKVQVARTLNEPSISGTLRVPSGYLLFPGSRFRVIPVGTIDFNYDYPNPASVVLDIRAQTTLSQQLGAAPGGAGGYRVEISVRGPMQEPRVALQSNPPGLEMSQILALLGQQAGVGPAGFSGGADLQKEVARLFTANIAPGMLEPVETALAEAFGLDEIAFGFGQERTANVLLSRRLFDGVSMSVLYPLGEDEEERMEWKLTYDLRGRIRASYGENRFGVRSVGIEGYFRF